VKATKMMRVEILTKELARLLEGNNCLVDLDDISSMEEWDQIMQHFSKFDNQCLIVVTTREERIAKHCSKNQANVYKLNVLKYNDSLRFFKKSDITMLHFFRLPLQ
jgi:hypothetical protein